jgi:hypothetical protein
MKKVTIIFIIIGVLAISAYVFVRHSLGTKGVEPPAANGAPAPKPAESLLDLRPRLITKLQELVNTGSGGLYRLSIREIEPDVLASTLSLKNIRLTPDSAVLRNLESTGHRPDDVFSFSLDSLRIEGIGINDLLAKDVIDLKTILLLAPTIEIFHQKPENTKTPGDATTLYQRLNKQLKHLSINQLTIRGGTVIVHQYAKKKATRFNAVEANLSGILLDSSTQYDKKRFLFAEDANLSTKNIGWRTADDLYDVKIGMASIAATKGRLSLTNMQLAPRYSKDEFQNHVKVMTERFSLSIPSAELHDVDWWDLINEDILQASSADINNADFSVYLDHRQPSGPPNKSNFPHQLLMAMYMKIYIPVVRLNHIQVASEEFSKLSDQAGTLYVTDLQGTVTNLTNMPSAIKKNSHTKVEATGIFMHKIKAKLGLDFDLANYRSGAFGASLSAKDLDPLVINPLAAPMGLFKVERGTVQLLESHLKGNSKGATGQVKFNYKQLRLSALEKDKKNPGELNKKHVTSILANVILIKDDNPSGNNAPRQADDAQFTYDPHTSFFNLIWKTTFVGILKIIGAPKKLATAR